MEISGNELPARNLQDKNKKQLQEQNESAQLPIHIDNQSNTKTKNSGISQFVSSPYVIKKKSNKRTRKEFAESNEPTTQMGNSKKLRTMKFIPALELIPELNEQNPSKDDVHEMAEEKKFEEVNENNIWKKDRKTRRQFYCSAFTTLVITPVKGRMLTSASSLIKFLGYNRNILGKIIKAHTHSLSWRTVYVHLSQEAKPNQVQEIIEQFNNQQQTSKAKINEQEKESDEVVIFPRCTLFQSGYAAEAQKRRIENVQNPDLNRWVLLKNVSKLESDEEISDTLERMDYRVEKVERFKGLPIVKVLLRSSSDVRKILNDNNILIGYQYAQVEVFDPYRRRPRRHFLQCKRCFGLNHTAENCNRKQVCKFCGKKNHSAEQCKFKKNYKRYQCVLCEGNHRSDSLKCPKIQQTREKAKIPYTKKELSIIEKLQSRKVATEANNKPRIITEIKNKPNTTSTSTSTSNKKQMSYSQALIGSNSNPKPINNNNKKEKKSNLQSENDEIKILREQVEYLQVTVNKLNLLVERLLPLVDQGNISAMSQNNLNQYNYNQITEDTLSQ